jgi:hypothetical protein
VPTKLSQYLKSSSTRQELHVPWIWAGSLAVEDASWVGMWALPIEFEVSKAFWEVVSVNVPRRE